MSVPWDEHCVTIYKKEKAFEGYTLVVPFTSNNAWLIDMEGNYVHRWKLRSQPRNHAVLLPDGNLLYASAGPLPPATDMSYPQLGSWGAGAGMVELDCEGNEVWEYVDHYQSHSFWRMDNGNTMICRITKVPDELGTKLKGGLPGSEDRGIIWTDGLREVTHEGETVWEWDMADHLDPDVHICCPIEHRADFTHMNSVQVLPNGDVMTNFRNISTTIIVEKATGNIKWQAGPSVAAHGHWPNILDNGNILVFDNGEHRDDGSRISYSKVLEINPETMEVEWEYIGNPPQSFYSALLAGAERLPNGNTLICESMKGRIFEVTKDGEIVWQYMNPFYAPHGSKGKVSIIGWRYSNAVFRAYRYAPDYPGIAGKDLSPENLPWINRLYGPEAFN